MAIKAGNMIVGGVDQSLPTSKNTKPTPSPRISVSQQIAAENNKPTANPLPVSTPKKIPEKVAAPKPHHEHTLKYDHNVLIVDGKPKKITKSSAYLLDMITKDLD